LTFTPQRHDTTIQDYDSSSPHPQAYPTAHAHSTPALIPFNPDMSSTMAAHDLCDTLSGQSDPAEELPVVVPPAAKGAGFLGAVVRFGDGSLWKLTRALSRTKYQQTQPPYEATQVFACTCLEDPDQEHNGVEEAVTKVKYQQVSDLSPSFISF